MSKSHKTLSSLSLSVALACIIYVPVTNANDAWGNGFDGRLGYMSTTSSTNIELSGPVGEGDIDIEDALDLDDESDTGRFDLSWRFKDRHKVSLDIYRLHRGGTNTANTDFSFTTEEGDFVEFEAGAEVSTKLNFDVYDISYSYSFIVNERQHLSAAVGLYWMDIEFEIKGKADGKIKIDGKELEPGDAGFSSNSEVGAPMPLIGIEYDYAVTPNWTLDVGARYFSVTVDPYSGSISNIDLSTSYNFEIFYVGGGYTWVDIDVDIDDDDWSGGISWEFSGPHIFIGARI